MVITYQTGYKLNHLIVISIKPLKVIIFTYLQLVSIQILNKLLFTNILQGKLTKNFFVLKLIITNQFI